MIENITLASSFVDTSQGKAEIELTIDLGKVIKTGNEANKLMFIGIKNDTVNCLSLILDALSKEFDLIFPVDLPDKDNMLQRLVRRIKP